MMAPKAEIPLYHQVRENGRTHFARRRRTSASSRKRGGGTATRWCFVNNCPFILLAFVIGAFFGSEVPRPSHDDPGHGNRGDARHIDLHVLVVTFLVVASRILIVRCQFRRQICCCVVVGWCWVCRFCGKNRSFSDLLSWGHSQPRSANGRLCSYNCYLSVIRYPPVAPHPICVENTGELPESILHLIVVR